MNQQPTFPCESFPTEPRDAKLLGVYPQRQQGLYMQRVRVPGGRLTASQWRALAAIARKHTPGTPLHLTTRQDVEFHDLTPDAVPLVQRALAAVGLTTFGTGGDTVRNITICPCSGLSCAELEPLAKAIQSELDSYDRLALLPRKFKISLSGSPQCGQPHANDVAFVVQEQAGVLGFRVVGAGSLGPRPGLGILLREWISPQDVLPLTLAALDLFDSLGDRENRSKARLRHVRERLGDDEFLRRLEERFVAVRQSRQWPEVQVVRPGRPMPEGTRLTFANGDVWPDCADALAGLIENHALSVRIGVYHQVLVCGTWTGALDAVRHAQSLAEAAAPQPAIVACPGTRWCPRGVVDTAGLADRIRREIATKLDPAAVICISGCPNGCTQDAVARFGLSGRVATVDGKRVDAFNLVHGGDEGRGPALAKPAGEKLTADEAIEKLASLSGQALVEELVAATWGLEPQRLLAVVLERLGDSVALASSLGAEDQVLTDMLVRVRPRPRVFTLDTGLLPAQTLAAIAATNARYGIDIKTLRPDPAAVEGMVAAHGSELFRQSVERRKLCCQVRKVHPLRKELATLRAWITGLRREQSPTREGVAPIEWDAANGLVKINPLADWSTSQVWQYIRDNNVPYNALHDKGYPSIGCDPCTRAVTAGQDVRSGRWWWEEPCHKECGLHVVDGKLVRKET